MIVMEDGSPKWKKVLFWSGDICVLFKQIPTTRNGVPHTKFMLFSNDSIESRYPDVVNEDTLDYEIRGEGLFIKEYPEQFIHRCSGEEWYIMLCNFDGSLILDNELKVKSLEIKSLESVIDSLSNENESLREKLKTARSHSEELKGGVNDVQHL